MLQEATLISVIGSLNVDLVTRATRIPKAGETLTSESFDIGWGGKGANQAVACARLSRTQSEALSNSATDVSVRMVGAVGKDEFHDAFLKSLECDGVNSAGVRVVEEKKTGVAVILVETGSGENRIMVNPGANYEMKVEDLVGQDTSVVLFQLELPVEVVLHNIRIAKQRNIEIVLNPAPAVALLDETYLGLGHLIVNETEATILSGIENPTDWDAVADIFIERGVRNVVITLGSKGVFYKTNAVSKLGQLVPAQKVNVVDSTAAGDTFTGAYTVAVARWKATLSTLDFDIHAAVVYANRAASITVQKEGAQSSIPWADQIPER